MEQVSLQTIHNELKAIQKDVQFIKHVFIEDVKLNEEVRPEYLQKLKKIQKQKGIPFKNIAELRKIIEG